MTAIGEELEQCCFLIVCFWFSSCRSLPTMTDLRSHLRASLVTASKREKREGMMGFGRAVGFGRRSKWSLARICTGQNGVGMLPKNSVNTIMMENWMALERDRRRKLLHKYVDACSSAKVKTEIMLIESDTVAKAILELIPTQNIRNLVVGTTKSSLRKLRFKKGSGIASQILQNAPETSCNIKIICKGKEVIDDTMFTGSTSSRSSNANSLSTQDEDDHQEQRISTDYNKHEYSRPEAKSPSSLNGYKQMWWGKPKSSQITA
ncbi:U-box domain-containing protein 37-like isoform X1 [Pyrus x bretschneideri]|uniref:U-box domain-containing protein 37-like isoform X1 n=1 Tax=Pyrus x bretschneideri TaxID=225117 RepID=UPI00202EB794|nr:U-box domain-containing protein 37-like isoform X1 [Pyrus x bretschneideri]XP_048428949.1 U-box domain-containing protein 37-like isoform X1 [Pyrus x bretschneideri]XP_048428950.1 U-box domain-containing protein 37-like isoform X1 [Pyrus x bretschneideri]XP_048428951.1 U-box domain-containing protein 37-like isoform X1 [Pyrus x bretschneideri]XP_048428952.1 U-box domain-containing protein 37-like isoform X1 [Pyrus x bretschneideri]XP_048428953.1 U-box domain-containing protein 37-like isofo